MDHPANTNMLWLGLAKAIAKGDSDRNEVLRAVVLAGSLDLPDEFVRTYIADSYPVISWDVRCGRCLHNLDHTLAMHERDIALAERAGAGLHAWMGSTQPA